MPSGVVAVKTYTIPVIFYGRRRERQHRYNKALWEQHRKLVFSSIEGSTHLYRTVKGIAQDTKLPELIVWEILETDTTGKVVKYPYRMKGNVGLYTTRHHFLKNAPWWVKLCGALKGRLL